MPHATSNTELSKINSLDTVKIGRVDGQFSILEYIAVLLLLTVHISLLFWVGYNSSPNVDEVGHLPSGLIVLHEKRYDFYAVNPPLVKIIAALVVDLFCSYRLPDVPALTENVRPEFFYGDEFLGFNDDYMTLFRVARWGCIMFSLVGGWTCYRWAKDLYGIRSGFACLSLWCFSPSILGWGSTICPDVAAASTGVFAAYTFYTWIKEPRLASALVSGIALGICEISKMTWIILFVLWPCFFLLTQIFHSTHKLIRVRVLINHLLQLFLILLLGIIIINFAYIFTGTFKSLGEYNFKSNLFNSIQNNKYINAFHLADMPLPFPSDYVSGMDIQKNDFEEGKESYLLGCWKTNGWYSYYLFCLLYKEPLGTVILFVVATLAFVTKHIKHNHCDSQLTNRYRTSFSIEIILFLIILPLVFLIFVSSQNGFSRHYRYVLFLLPIGYIWISQIFVLSRWRLIGCILLISSTLSSIWHLPFSVSYFNELCGGPTNGYKYLLDSNIDWQQDVYRLRKWIESRNDISQIHVRYYGDNLPEKFGIISAGIPPLGKFGKDSSSECFPEKKRRDSDRGPVPGWHAISVHCLNYPLYDYKYFFEYEPVEKIGYSILIYNISLEQANEVRRKLGMPNIKPPVQVMGISMEHAIK